MLQFPGVSSPAPVFENVSPALVLDTVAPATMIENVAPSPVIEHVTPPLVEGSVEDVPSVVKHPVNDDVPLAIGDMVLDTSIGSSRECEIVLVGKSRKESCTHGNDGNRDVSDTSDGQRHVIIHRVFHDRGHGDVQNLFLDLQRVMHITNKNFPRTEVSCTLSQLRVPRFRSLPQDSADLSKDKV